MIYTLGDRIPRIDDSAYVADNATIIGSVEIGPEASIWFGDSGGAVLTLDNKLIGIMSYMEKTRGGMIYENGCASVEYYKNWIEEIKHGRTMERMGTE